MRKIVFDIETKNVFEEVGSNDPAKLDLSVVCIHDSADDKYKSFLEKDLKKLWPILEGADMLVGFNSDHFDIPILSKYYSGDLRKIRSLDLMKEIKNVLGRRIKLDTVAKATLGRKKTGNGMEAIGWWKSGELQKIIDYCIEDVKITKELYEYALRHGNLKYKDKDSDLLKEIKLDTSNWEKKTGSSLTHTLPF